MTKNRNKIMMMLRYKLVRIKIQMFYIYNNIKFT